MPITLVLWTSALILLEHTLVLGVDARAVLAVIFLDGPAQTLLTTVSTVIVATYVIIDVIAVSIALPGLVATFGCSSCWRDAVGIQTCTLAAVTRSFVWPTAIAAIVVARRQVVVVVTLTISLVVGSTASGWFLVRVQALARCAVELLGVCAAIAATVVARRLVVVVVAVAVALVSLVATVRFFRWHVVGIQAFARCAVSLSNVWPTAIAAIVVARRHVVVVVTLAISLVVGSTASGRLCCRWFVVRVQALALCAVELLGVCAAIAAIVVARRLVVVVVAVAVALVSLVATVRFFRWHVVGIQAFARCAVSLSNVWPTAIAAIVVARRHVVVVVTPH